MNEGYLKNDVGFKGLTVKEFAHRHNLPVWKVRYLVNEGRVVGVFRHPLNGRMFFNENARITELKVRWS